MKNEIMAFFVSIEESNEVVPNEARAHKEENHHAVSADNVVRTLWDSFLITWWIARIYFRLVTISALSEISLALQIKTDLLPMQQYIL